MEDVLVKKSDLLVENGSILVEEKLVGRRSVSPDESSKIDGCSEPSGYCAEHSSKPDACLSAGEIRMSDSAAKPVAENRLNSGICLLSCTGSYSTKPGEIENLVILCSEKKGSTHSLFREKEIVYLVVV